MATTRPLKLYDRADMVKDHYCIGRLCEDGRTNEYWCESADRFGSAGTVYNGKKAAQAKLKEVRAFLKLSPQEQRLTEFAGGLRYAINESTMIKGHYTATLQLKQQVLSAQSNSPEMALFDLGVQTARWIKTGLAQ